jgi:hypothetical protein
VFEVDEHRSGYVRVEIEPPAEAGIVERPAAVDEPVTHV